MNYEAGFIACAVFVYAITAVCFLTLGIKANVQRDKFWKQVFGIGIGLGALMVLSLLFVEAALLIP